MLPETTLDLSGERLSVIYRLIGDEEEAKRKAEDICVEQTIEFPLEFVPDDDIRGKIVGQIENFEGLDNGSYEATISFPVEIVGADFVQLLNLVFGNISIKPGIRLERFCLPDRLLAVFTGPRFGRQGWRARLEVPKRPLLCTALKPLGLSNEIMADLAYQFALGGIDIIKDDHSIADQDFSPYRERLERCVAAVERANRETGYRCVYMPNITASADDLVERARLAKRCGAGAVLVSPGLIGFDTMRRLSADDRLSLPIMSHPAFQGSFVVSPENGISHQALLGQICRLAGADATIYPNYGGRFSFNREECHSIVEGASAPMGSIKPIFPTPGGGMSMDRVPSMIDLYGREAIFLIGGDLHRRGSNLVKSCQYFRRLVEGMVPPA